LVDLEERGRRARYRWRASADGGGLPMESLGRSHAQTATLPALATSRPPRRHQEREAPEGEGRGLQRKRGRVDEALG